MQVLEMQKALKVRLQKLDTNSYIDIRVEILDYYLNIALTKLVKKIAYPKNPKDKGFEEDTKRQEDLGGLVKAVTLFPSQQTAPDPNGTIYVLPSDYWFVVRERVKVNYTDCNNDIKYKWNSLIPAKLDRLNKILDDPFKKPDVDENVRVTYDIGNEIITDNDTSCHDYLFIYIKKPKILIYDITKYQESIFNITSGLTQDQFTTVLETRDELTDEIVDLAESLLLENIESKRFQTNFEQLIK